MLVCVTGVLESGENVPMFHEWRRGACGDWRSLEECPGQVLDSAEVSALASLLQFALMNRWDALAVTQWRGVGVDHEGALLIGAESEAECRRVLAGQS